MLENQSDKKLTASATKVREAKKRRVTLNSPSRSILEVRSISSSSKSVPHDLIFGIFTRLPVKSLIRFKCIAKFYSITITNPSFALVHQPYLEPKPSLLFTCSTKHQSTQIFFAVSQNGNRATHLLTIPPRFSRYTTQSVNGILCMDFGICATICNPSTRQAISLPFPFPKNSFIASTTNFYVNFLGFNPNDKQYKVLNSWGNYKMGTTEYMVFTLGTKKWRRVHGGPNYFAQRESICISGIIFFRSWMSLGTINRVAALVSFDVQTESFRVINLPRGAPHNVDTSCLIQLEGRLVIIDYRLDREHYCLWLLEDYCNEIWAKRYITFPSYLEKRITGLNFVVSGTIDTGEITMVAQCLSTPFSPFTVFYYNPSTGNFRRVRIFGLPNYNALNMSCNDVTVTNYVENILPLCQQAS
ncbi:hypothetical protein GH714_021675 [Hevea brasiliensis]|uniref:F-box associated beta-propeller type 3 domain-containing protein n=1 Tax=Hevea brasiliensis TaxID=3981 RepID=A0A6A6L7G7_HEVBR|nr:hypothetical protein GH714_021675 [Hevea brasiliensis]